MAKKLIFFIDFDGTITRQDVCNTMVKTFAREGWAELNSLWEEGALSTRDCAQATLDLMTVLPGELEDFFMQMEIDPTFPAFLKWAEEEKHPVYILSDGYANYIEPILKKAGIQIEYYANFMQYQEGWHIHTPHLNTECGKCGVCKKGKIEELADAESIKIYIGDGYSDLCPARYCEIVFAKQTLAKLCLQEGIPFFYYQDFAEILHKMQEIFIAEEQI